MVSNTRKNCTDDIVIMIVGNKNDLDHLREVPIDSAQDFAKINNLLFMETSTLNATDIELAFDTLFRAIYNIADRYPMKWIKGQYTEKKMYLFLIYFRRAENIYKCIHLYIFYCMVTKYFSKKNEK